MKTIEIVVAPDGSTRVETRGFTGATCREASRFLEQALGRTSAEHTTAEFHQVLASQAVDQHYTT
ncbi:MAG: hypothetical protein C0483_10435 [Pirellula sp.]|nr:hypothetical protein [Pirellula sp.]